jgi:hypothetical protein
MRMMVLRGAGGDCDKDSSWSAPGVVSFGSILREYRMEAGLTRAAVAEQAGLITRAI